MTSLNIVQSKSQTEQVSSAIIDKLYRLALTSKVESNTSDFNMSLQGNITAYAAYKDAVDYLTSKFQNLIINVNSYYIRFLDNQFERICVNNYSSDGIGCTAGDLSAVTKFSDQFKQDVSNSSIQCLDLRYFIGLSGDLWYKNFSNISTLESAYVKNIQKSVALNFVYNCGTGGSEGTKPTLNRLIIDGAHLSLTDSTMSVDNRQPRCLAGSTENKQNYGTLAIRRIGPRVTLEFPNEYNSYFVIGDYFTRGISIQNFYLDEKNPERVKLSQGYGDNINRVVNMYVPLGCAQAYAASTTWGQLRTSEFLEYDFDNDPDGIFSVFD